MSDAWGHMKMDKNNVENATEKLKTYFKRSLNTDKVSIRVTDTKKNDENMVIHFKVSAIFLDKELDYTATFNPSGEIVNLKENGR